MTDRFQGRELRRAVHRRRRMARRAGAAPLRPRRLRGRRHALLLLLPARRAVRGPVLPPGAADVRHRVRRHHRRALRRCRIDRVRRRQRRLPRRVEPRAPEPVPRRGSDDDRATARSAAVARYSRIVAAEMYGEHRPYGYVYGGSGGAFKTISCFENTTDVWDGAVPFVGADADEHAVRVLRAGARHAPAVGQVPRHHRRHRAGRQRRHVRRARPSSSARRSPR